MEHKEYITEHGEDLAEVCDWKRSGRGHTRQSWGHNECYRRMTRRPTLGMGSKPTPDTWLQWVEPWYVAYGLLGTTVGGLVPIVLPPAFHSGGGPAYVGWVMTAYNLGGLTAPLWSALADRYRLHRWLTVGGGMITVVGLAVFPLTTSPVARLGLALLQGMGAVGVATIANLLVVEAHPQEEWEERIGWLQTFYGAGQVGGLFMAGAVTQWPLHIGLFAAAVLTGLAVLTGWITTRTPPGPLIPNPTLLYPPRPSEWPMISSPQHLFHHLTLNTLRRGWQDIASPFALFLASWLLCFKGSWTFFSQYPVLMQQTYEVSPWLLSASSAVAHGLGLFLYVPAGLWSERHGAERVLTFGLSVRLLAFLSLFGLVCIPVGGQGLIPLLCVIVVVLTWSLLSVSGTALTAHLAQMGEGEGMGLFNATTAFAGVTGAALGGWVAERWGYQVALVLPVAGVTLSLFVALALRRYTAALATTGSDELLRFDLSLSAKPAARGTGRWPRHSTDHVSTSPMADDPQDVGRYLRCKRAWFVIDTQGVIRYVDVIVPGSPEHLPNEELLKLLNELK